VHNSNHYDVDRIFVSLSWELHCRWQLDRMHELWWAQGDKRAHNSTIRWVSAQLLYVCVTAW